jgi:hypothetical protein
LVAGAVDVCIDDFDIGTTQHGAESRARRGAEMKIAGDQRLRRHAATGPNHFHRQAFVAMVALFDGDEFIHVAAGHGGH